MTRFILTVTVFISMKSAAGIDYVDVSPGGDAGDVDDVSAPAASSAPGLATSRDTSGNESPNAPEALDAPEDPPESTPETAALVSADVHAVTLGLWASGLRCIIVYALAPAVGPLGPLAVGAALVIQVVGAAVSVSGARSLWVQHHRGRRAYALIAMLTCLCTLVALLAPAGF